MSKPLEEHLAEYLLGLARGAWTNGYNRLCLALWREKYGDRVVERAERIAREQWKK
jgi:hypothetical protein